jgi:hypothetical protein
VSRWKAALEASLRMGGEAGELIIMPPAAPEAVADVETQLATAMPLSFKATLLEFSSQVEAAWTLPEEAILPPELEGISCGLCDWNFEGMIDLNAWLKDFLRSEDDSFGDNWQNALLFSHVPNGDCLAFDTRITPDSPIIYSAVPAMKIGK